MRLSRFAVLIGFGWLAVVAVLIVRHQTLPSFEDSDVFAPPLSGFRVAAVTSQPVTAKRGALPRVLSKESLAPFVDPATGIVVVAFSNYLFRDMTVNLCLGLDDAGVTTYVVIALDRTVGLYLDGLGAPVLMLSSLGVSFVERDSGRGAQFNEINRAKYSAVATMLEWGFHVLVLDVDVAAIRNPLPWLHENSQHIDLMMQTDYIHTETFDDGGEILDRGMVHFYCIGILFARATPASRSFFAEWMRRLHADHEMLDQTAMMDILNKRLVRHPGKGRSVSFGNLTVAALPTMTFCNGHVYYIQRLPQQMGIRPFVVHSTFQFSFAPGKIHSMREAFLWHDPPEYYAGRFLSFDLEVPLSMLEYTPVEWGAVPVRHIQLARAQLRQVFRALAIAQATKRILILPRLRCSCERYWWYLVDCRVSDKSTMPMPFICPADHLLDIRGMSEAKIKFRAASFLDHPKAPHALLAERVVVELPSDALRSLDQWKEALDAPAMQAASVVHLSSVGAGVIFESLAARFEFDRLCKTISTVWCCYGNGRDEVPFWEDSMGANVMF